MTKLRRNSTTEFSIFTSQNTEYSINKKTPSFNSKDKDLLGDSVKIITNMWKKVK